MKGRERPAIEGKVKFKREAGGGVHGPPFPIISFLVGYQSLFQIMKVSPGRRGQALGRRKGQGMKAPASSRPQVTDILSVTFLRVRWIRNIPSQISLHLKRAAGMR